MTYCIRCGRPHTAGQCLRDGYIGWVDKDGTLRIERNDVAPIDDPAAKLIRCCIETLEALNKMEDL
jgi:hypothetical protein